MATNDYKAFAVGTGNQVTAQLAYTSAEWRATGFVAGILQHADLNKVLRQATLPAAALSQAISDLLAIDVLDDGDLVGYTTKLKLAFGSGLPYVPGGNPAGSIGAALDTINTSGGAGVNADLLKSLLAGQLTETQFTVQLRNRLNQLDTPTTGLVAVTSALQATYGSTASAATSASQAAQARIDAIVAQNAAAISQGAALTSQQQAATSATNAATSASSASTSATNASSSSSSAAGAAAAANTSATNAATAATTATDRATASGTSATAAAVSAGTAGAAATSATSSANTATTQASNASTSATAAAGSATTAAGSAATAGTSALNAANSATTAGGAATAASGSASTASTQATNAAAAANAAQSSATAAGTSQAAASTSAGQASTAATNSASSASSASTSASTASSASTTAGNSATAANTSAANAATSANNAGNSATSAASYYNSTVSATGSLTAAVTQESNTRASQVAGLDGRLTTSESNYVLKTVATRSDGKKVFGGIGVASSATGTIGQSEIILQADRLVFVPSSDPNAPLSNLLTVGTVNGVTTLIVPAAIIGDATIGTLKVAANSMTDVQSVVVPTDDFTYPANSASGVNDRTFSILTVTNPNATDAILEISISGWRRIVVPVVGPQSGSIGPGIDVYTGLFILNNTLNQLVSKLTDNQPELIAKQANNTTSTWRLDAANFQLTLPASTTFTIQPYARMYHNLTGASGTINLQTRAYSMRVTTVKR